MKNVRLLRLQVLSADLHSLVTNAFKRRQIWFFGGFLPPVFLHTPTQSDLLSHLRADRVGEDDLGQIGLDGADAAARRQRADVHHQHLVLGELLDLQGREEEGRGSEQETASVSVLMTQQEQTDPF